MFGNQNKLMKLIPFTIFAILFVCIFVYAYRRGNKSQNNVIAASSKDGVRNNTQDNAYNGLRKQAIEITAGQLGLHLPDNQLTVYGIVMDIGMSQGVATLIAYKTGDASLYLSTGGGIIGGGKYKAVIEAAQLFINAGQEFLKRANKAENTTVATKDTVKFYLLTNRGVYLLVEEIKKFDNNSSIYNSLFADGNLLLTQLRSSGSH